MSLNQMKLVSIVGNLDDLDDVAAALGDTGVFQPDEASEYYSDSENLIPLIAADDFSPVLDRLKAIMIESGIRPDIVNSDRFDHTDLDTVRKMMDELESDLGALVEKRRKCSDQIAHCKDMIEKMRHFIGLGIDVSKVVGCQYIVTRFGKLPNDSYKKLAEFTENPFVEFFPCTHDGEYYWGVYAAPIGEAEKIDRIFSRLYFEKVDVEGIQGAPKDYVASLEDEVKALEKESSDLTTAINNYVKENKQYLLELYTALCKHHAYLTIKQHACKYYGSFVLIGWIPKEYAGVVGKAMFMIEGVEITFTKASEEAKHSPPVKLKNRFFFKPFEYYTGMYGLPNYREIDPSWFIACTYTLLFGIMFADVGQGIMLLIAAIYMYKKMEMPLGALLIPCAISSTIFGFVFGSVFGFEEALNPVYKLLFGLDEKPIDVLEGQTTMMLIYSAVAIGVILLIIAMILNILSSVKRGEIGEALFGTNGLAGLVFYTSLIVGLVAKFAFNTNFMTTVYILLLIVLPLILIFFREPLSKLLKHEKNIFGGSIGSFIVDNIFEMFEVGLSYVTNTMSFLRVGAFILVHAGMMKVVFVLAGMFDPVGYVITVIIGNIIVMALEALLVGIQVLRLEYYEMFSRFYIGDGRAYHPVTVNNKV